MGGLLKIHRGLAASRASFIIMCLLFIAFEVYFQPNFSGMALWKFIAEITLGLGTAILLQYLDRQYALIKTKSVLPAFFYVLFLFAYAPVLTWENLLLGLMLLLCLFLLFSTYQSRDSQTKVLNMFILLSLGCLLWYPVILLFPVMWYGMYVMQSLNFRTFLASLAGVFLVCLGLFTWGIYQSDINLFMGFMPDWQSFTRFKLPVMDIPEYAFMGYLLILYLFCLANLFRPDASEKVKAKTIIGYILILAAVLFLFFFLYIVWEDVWLILLFIPLSILYAHLFAKLKNKLMIWFFLLTILLFIAKGVLNVLM